MPCFYLLTGSIPYNVHVPDVIKYIYGKYSKTKYSYILLTNIIGTVANFYMSINIYFVDHISCVLDHHFSFVSVNELSSSSF